MEHRTPLALFDRQTRRDARPDGPEYEVERVGDVVRQTGPAHGWNGVLWSDLDEARAGDAIARQVRHFTALGRSFEWKLYAHDGPADLGDLGERLRGAGFVPEPEEALMVAGATGVAGLRGDGGGSGGSGSGGGRAAVSVPEGIRIRPVTDGAGVELVAEVHERAFGADGTHLRRRLLEQLTERPHTVAAFVAMAGDRPVGSARLELPPGTVFAGLWGGGTVPEWRGRGVYRALVAHRARVAAAHGYRYVQVDASDRIRPVLRRLGFTRLSTTTPYVYEP
ncbi:GNAT family N-acetyltransferase [Streptomyces lavendulocolor]|uniref:GNAT family N-acetyltransferase n=1 Tax=Streptomyces lavendulocolor TaxID=67316 RepID=UPI003C2ADC41